MKIAVATDKDRVSLHFGKCSEYRVFYVEDDKIVKEEKLECPAHQPGMLPKYLADHDIDCIIAGGMGPRAEDLCANYGIKVITGVLGLVNDVVASYLDDTLKIGDSSCEHLR